MKEKFRTAIPLPGTDCREHFAFSVPREMTEEQWAFAMKVLRKMKPALVRPDPPSTPEVSPPTL